MKVEGVDNLFKTLFFVRDKCEIMKRLQCPTRCVFQRTKEHWVKRLRTRSWRIWTTPCRGNWSGRQHILWLSSKAREIHSSNLELRVTSRCTSSFLHFSSRLRDVVEHERAASPVIVGHGRQDIRRIERGAVQLENQSALLGGHVLDFCIEFLWV